MEQQTLEVKFGDEKRVIELPAHGEVIFTIAENRVKFIETRDKKKI